MCGCLTVLIDRSVEARLQFGKDVLVDQTVRWGPDTFSAPVCRTRLRPDLSAKPTWYRNEVAALPTVARLAREGLLRLCTYPELHREGMSASSNVTLTTRGDLRVGLRIAHVEAAVERGFFQQMEFSAFLAHDQIMSFYEMLLNLDYAKLCADVPQYVQRLPAFSQRNLAHLSRFKELCVTVGKKHYRDAFHLWTGEAHQMAYFLTLDRKFIRAVTGTSKLRLTTLPVLPLTLLGRLGVARLDPIPLESGVMYDWRGRPTT